MVYNKEIATFPLTKNISWQKFDAPIRELSARCCVLDAKQRPTMTEVLEEIRQETQVHDSLLSWLLHRNMKIHFANTRSPTTQPLNGTSAYRQSAPNGKSPATVRGLTEMETTLKLSDFFGDLRLTESPTSSAAEHTFSSADGNAGETPQTFASASQPNNHASDLDDEERTSFVPPRGKTNFFNMGSNGSETDPSQFNPTGKYFQLLLITCDLPWCNSGIAHNSHAKRVTTPILRRLFSVDGRSNEQLSVHPEAYGFFHN